MVNYNQIQLIITKKLQIMLNNFIYTKTKDLFVEQLEAGNVLDEAIVFIEDTKEIWNHGTYFDGKSVDISNIEESIQNIINNKAEKSELPTKTSELTNDSGFITIEDVPTGSQLKTYTFEIGDNNYNHREYTITQEELEKIQNADIVYIYDGTSNIQLTAKEHSNYIIFSGYDLDLYPDDVRIFCVNVLTSLEVMISVDSVGISDYISDYIGEAQSSYVVAACEEIVDGASIGVIENLEIVEGWFSSPNPIMLILASSYGDTVSLIGPYAQYSEDTLIFKFIGEYNDQTIECVLDIDTRLWSGTLHIKPKSEGDTSIDLSNYVTKEELNIKQDIIDDLDIIRTGAALGTTALQAETYKGTITGVSANGTSIATNGVANIPAASTSEYGVTKLSSAIDSTSTSLAATASAVKSAYDLANGKQDALISGTNIKTINGTSILGSGDITISGDSSSGSGAYSEVNHGTSDTTFTLTPNTFHVWEEVTELNLDFGAETAGVANEYLFQFSSGATATTLTLPDTIKWANNEVPTIEANMIYQVSILKGLASCLMFSSFFRSFPLVITDENINENYLDVYNYLVSTYELTNTLSDSPNHGINIKETINITCAEGSYYEICNGVVMKISLFNDKVLLWTDRAELDLHVLAINSDGIINRYMWD